VDCAAYVGQYQAAIDYLPRAKLMQQIDFVVCALQGVGKLDS
jgi:hypothetical protein